jgi:hypothetical protein
MTLCQIYRCWTVYGRSWRVIIAPLLLLLCNILNFLIVKVIVGINVLGVNSNGFDHHMVATYYASTIFINIYATCT